MTAAPAPRRGVRRRPIAVAASALLLALAASTAAAHVVPAFTATPAGNQTVVLDASATVCEFGPCGYTWRWDDGTRLGVTIGSGVRVTYRFPESGTQTVVLKVSEHCAAGSASFCPATASKQVVVPPAPGSAPPPPPATRPPAAAAPKAAVKAGQVIRVTAAIARVRREPGKILVGSLARGDRFRVDRTHRVRRGPAQGLWYHGTGTATGTRARPLKVPGWVKASAFA
jgi:hypothetical protein